MSEVPVPAPEIVRNPERLLSYEPLVGLQTRMLLGGENLNSKNRTLPDITSDQIDGSLSARQRTTYQYLSNASTLERKEWWKAQGIDSLDEQLKIWVERTTHAFQTGKDFFHQNGWHDIFAKLGINSDTFSNQSALNLYNEYFTGDDKKSQTSAFINKVINAYAQKSADGQVINIDYQSLKRDLPAFQWLAGMFGVTGKEVNVQLIEAEVRSRIPQEKTILINEANEKEKVDDQDVARLNRISDKEVELLDYLYKGKDPNTLPDNDTPPDDSNPPEDEKSIEEVEKEDPFRSKEPTTEDVKRYKTLLRRVDSQKDANSPKFREFPLAEDVKKFTDPSEIADALKRGNPLYITHDKAALTQEIANEDKEFQEWLKKIHIDPERYNLIIQKNINMYGSYLKEKYGINLPEIDRLTVIPIYGKRAEVWKKGNHVLGFFNPRYPVLFINFDALKHMTRSAITPIRPESTPSEQDISPDKKIGIMIEKLLTEVQPHEYTHALGDIANWHLIKDEGTQDEKITDIEPAKLGLFLVKPYPPKVSANESLIAIERGRGLMEAVTETLSKQWIVETKGHPPKVPAYLNEINVLNILIDDVASKYDLPREKVFQKFVDAYFNPGGFRKLADFLSGKKIVPVGKETTTRPDGTTKEIEKVKVKYDENRKHFLQVIYALMEYESQSGKHYNYDLTINYIRGNLNSVQQAEIESFLNGYSRKTSTIQLTPEAIKEIRNTIRNVQPETKAA